MVSRTANARNVIQPEPECGNRTQEKQPCSIVYLKIGCKAFLYRYCIGTAELYVGVTIIIILSQVFFSHNNSLRVILLCEHKDISRGETQAERIHKHGRICSNTVDHVRDFSIYFYYLKHPKDASQFQYCIKCTGID